MLTEAAEILYAIAHHIDLASIGASDPEMRDRMFNWLGKVDDLAGEGLDETA